MSDPLMDELMKIRNDIEESHFRRLTLGENQCKPFLLNGILFYRNGQNGLWLRFKEREVPRWVGVYDPLTQKVDTTIPSPYTDENKIEFL